MEGLILNYLVLTLKTVNTSAFKPTLVDCILTSTGESYSTNYQILTHLKEMFHYQADVSLLYKAKEIIKNETETRRKQDKL